MANPFELRLYTSLEKIFPHHAPESQESPLRLTALLGETVSFQIAYRLPAGRYRSWGRLSVDGPPGVDVTLRRRVNEALQSLV